MNWSMGISGQAGTLVNNAFVFVCQLLCPPEHETDGIGRVLWCCSREASVSADDELWRTCRLLGVCGLGQATGYQLTRADDS